MEINQFPDSLPGPASGAITPAERRFKTVGIGPLGLRAAQLAYLGTQQLQWAILTAAEAEIFFTWWRDTLIQGGAWFTANWTSPAWPDGYTAQRRFITSLVWNHIPGGNWSVSGVVEIRLAKTDLSAPEVSECFLEAFDTGLDEYSITGGDAFAIVSSAYGPALQIAGGPITSFQSTADRDFPAFTFSTATFKVRLDSFPTGSNPDDGPFFDLRFDTDSVLLFDTSREQFFDGARRPYVGFNGSFVVAAPAALAVGVWHEATLRIVSPTTVTFTLKVVGGATLQVTTFTGVFTTLAADQFVFFDSFSFGGSDVKCGGTFDEIELCP